MTEDERAFQAYSKIAEQITKEDGLVNQRLTWGASINGALLTLLGVGGGLFKDALRDAPIGVTIFVLCDRHIPFNYCSARLWLDH